MVATPREEWPSEVEAPEFHAELKQYWEEPWGDRRQELVLIGKAMDQEALSALLNECLLSDAEMAEGGEAWKTYKDPFPAWAEDTDTEVAY